jgi:predicted AlkP superfamily pyrophosphatase or phosphodiesterase
MKNVVLLFILSISINFVSAQKSQIPLINPDKPKLVVGIVVDQMRYDYLTRFWDKYGDGGFKRLVNEGFNFKNNHFNYIPTYTAPGHTSIYTGTTPENHGIIGNNWYNKFEEKEVYCVEDSNFQSVGTNSSAGKMSPHRMISTTVADENRLFTQMQGKTIGIGLKDRSAILPAGHSANAAYWFHGMDEGKWISSTYYMDKLPVWVQEFNKSGKAISYLKEWNTLGDIETYSESGADKNDFEGGFSGSSVFPYNLAELAPENGQFELLKYTPFGNSITTDFAIATLEGEDLGTDEFTDFLTISYSSTDYIGHNFGVNSKEVQDAYMRLDKDIAKLLKALDEKVGEGNYTLFLTADHGAVDVPSYLQSVKIPAGYFENEIFEEELNEFIEERFGIKDLIEMVSNYQIFFNYEEVADEKLNAVALENAIAHFVLQQPQVNRVFTRTQLEANDFTSGISGLVKNGYNQRRSGDVIFVLKPAIISYSKTGSTHGSGFSYDTHAPLIFFGKGVPQGNTSKRSEIIDIAPTVSSILGISFPNASTGKPLYEMLDNK